MEEPPALWAGDSDPAHHHGCGADLVAAHQGHSGLCGKRDGQLHDRHRRDDQWHAHGQDFQSGTGGTDPAQHLHSRDQEPDHPPAGAAGPDEPHGRYAGGRDLYPDHRRGRLYGAEPGFPDGRGGHHRLYDRHRADL